MKKLTVLPLLALALALPATANAWSFSLSGTAACNPQTGTYDVSWTINNSSEPEALAFASRLGSGSAAAGGSSTQSETASGSTTSITLEVSGSWPSDRGPHSRSASVALAGNCAPPPAPPSPPPALPMSDDCPNVEGIQGSVPEGMVKDQNGDCAPRQTTTTESQPIASPPVAVPSPSVTTPPLAAPVIVSRRPTNGVASATKTKVKRKAVVKNAKAKKSKKKVAAGGVKGVKPRALPRTR
jgi:hypothetical protein